MCVCVCVDITHILFDGLRGNMADWVVHIKNMSLPLFLLGSLACPSSVSFFLLLYSFSL